MSNHFTFNIQEPTSCYWTKPPIVTGGDSVTIKLAWDFVDTDASRNYILKTDNPLFDIYVDTEGLDGGNPGQILSDYWETSVDQLLDGLVFKVTFTLPVTVTDTARVLSFSSTSTGEGWQGRLYELGLTNVDGTRYLEFGSDWEYSPNIPDQNATPLPGFRFHNHKSTRLDIEPITLAIGDSVVVDVTPMDKVSSYIFDSSGSDRPYLLTDGDGKWYFNTNYIQVFVNDVEVFNQSTYLDFDLGTQQVKAVAIAECTVDVIGQRYSDVQTGWGVYYNLTINSTVDEQRTYLSDSALGAGHLLPSSLADTTNYNDLSTATSADNAFTWDSSNLQWDKIGVEEDAILDLFDVVLDDEGYIEVLSELSDIDLIFTGEDTTVTVMAKFPHDNNIYKYLATQAGKISLRFNGTATGSITDINHFKGNTVAVWYGDHSVGWDSVYTETGMVLSSNSEVNWYDGFHVYKASTFAVVEEGMTEYASVNTFKGVALLHGLIDGVGVNKASTFAVVEEGMTDYASVNTFKGVALVSPTSGANVSSGNIINGDGVNKFKERLDGDNVLTNGDFADGSLDGWTVETGSGGTVNLTAEDNSRGPKGKGTFFFGWGGNYVSNYHMTQEGPLPDVVLEALGTKRVMAKNSFSISSRSNGVYYTNMDTGRGIVEFYDADGVLLVESDSGECPCFYKSTSWTKYEFDEVEIPVEAVSWKFHYKTSRKNAWAVLCTGDIELKIRIDDK